MQMTKPTLWILGAVSVGVIAALQNSADLFVVSAIIGGVGLIMKLPFKLQRTAPDTTRLREMEEHLVAAEDELSMRTRELTALREKHEFDLQLLQAKSESQDVRLLDRG